MEKHFKHVIHDYAIRIPAVLQNPKHPELRKEIKLLVDTGATGCVIPESVADELDLKDLCVGEGTSELADGNVVPCLLVYVCLQIEKQHVITVASVPQNAAADGEAIMGFDVLDILEIQVDVAGRRLLRPVKHFRVLETKRLLAFWWSKPKPKREG
jgi:predicted aspartyl protease